MGTKRRHGCSSSSYESAIRVAVRTNLSDPRLRRQFDSLDVCQSVLASFFLQMASGAYDLSVPAQLSALFAKMAQNKVRMRARDQFRQRRDVRRLSEVRVESCSGSAVARQVPRNRLTIRIYSTAHWA